jgi:hypothetical protein
LIPEDLKEKRKTIMAKQFLQEQNEQLMADNSELDWCSFPGAVIEKMLQKIEKASNFNSSSSKC